MKLWLDDLRDPAHYGHIGWHWVKTAKEAIELLKTGNVFCASLDHDLTVQQTLGADDKEDTGYTVICWMEEHNVWPPGGVETHSMNPAGKLKIQQVIDKYYFERGK